MKYYKKDSNIMLISYGEIFNCKDRFTVIFNHIPKCGGITFNSILYKCFSFYKDIIIYNCSHFIYFISLIAQLQKDFINYNNLFIGHFTWGLHNYINYNDKRNIYYITILRQPWNLFISQYKYMYIKGYFSYDIEKFFYKEYKHNILTKWLGDGDLELAKYNLEHKHYLFGITEKYDDFLKMFCFFFNFNCIEYNILNQTQDNIFLEKNKIDNLLKLKKEFVIKNRLDYELYEFSKKLFNKRFKEINTKSILINRKKNEVVKKNEAIFKLFQLSDINRFSMQDPIKYIVSSPGLDFDINLLFMYYAIHNNWKNIIFLCKAILKLVFERILNINCDSYLYKYIEYINCYKDIAYNRIKDINIENNARLFKKYYNILLKLININFIKFCKETNHNSIGFYGISGRLKVHFFLINKYLYKKQLFLFDSDIKKHGNKFYNLKILSPDNIAKINPDIIIITSDFWKEIYNNLVKIKKENNLSFKIMYLNNYHLLHIEETKVAGGEGI